ncbi:protein phosphatase 1 regulatory subunit 35 [Conger conger]|uniref:protein phosphatase 1 regulatory subunit 35 n=1 Tax=Conger conger TaxID=82655 RepID=UPI002A5A44F1|nr:protein phosphatase 1 regulatory subunit 35 [Conger conger]XP_061092456.1 protein phosphatase 1 regulatory subunit 35 [Conger conger]
MTKVSPRQQCLLAAGTDPDSQPVPQCPPAPMGYYKLVSLPDKDLTLTPDKVGKEAGILKRGRGGKQAQRQVRFDVSPRTKALEINPTRASGEEPGVITVISQSSYSPSELQHPIRTASKGKKNYKKRKDSKAKSRALPCDGRSEVLTQAQSEVPWEGAELNTTLALKVELEGLAEAAFDSRKAVQEQLKKSTHTKNNIAIKATEGVNIPRSQNLYQSLVSISVSEDQLISCALRDRLTLVPSNHSSKNQESPAEGPDLLAFYSPGELLRETPLLPGDGVQQSRPRPVPRPANATFDLYHRHRQWEA